MKLMIQGIRLMMIAQFGKIQLCLHWWWNWRLHRDGSTRRPLHIAQVRNREDYTWAALVMWGYLYWCVDMDVCKSAVYWWRPLLYVLSSANHLSHLRVNAAFSMSLYHSPPTPAQCSVYAQANEHLWIQMHWLIHIFCLEYTFCGEGLCQVNILFTTDMLYKHTHANENYTVLAILV